MAFALKYTTYYTLNKQNGQILPHSFLASVGKESLDETTARGWLTHWSSNGPNFIYGLSVEELKLKQKTHKPYSPFNDPWKTPPDFMLDFKGTEKAVVNNTLPNELLYTHFYAQNKQTGEVETRSFESYGKPVLTESEASGKIAPWNTDSDSHVYSLTKPQVKYSHYYTTNIGGESVKCSFKAAGKATWLTEEPANSTIADWNALYGASTLYSLQPQLKMPSLPLSFGKTPVFGNGLSLATVKPKKPVDPSSLKLWHMRARERMNFYNFITVAETQEAARVKILDRMKNDYGSSFYYSLTDTAVYEIHQEVGVVVEFAETGRG